MARGEPLQFELDDEDLRLFSEEAEEQIGLLDTALVQLEGEPDPELVQQIFRAAHTLKGSSATIGHRKMASVTHGMESVLDLVRQGQLTPTSSVVDALLAGLDALRILAQEVVTRIDSGTDVAAVGAQLQAVLRQGPEPPVVGEPASDHENLTTELVHNIHDEMRRGRNVFQASVRVERTCQLPGIRCFQVLQELDALGAVLDIHPERSVLDAGGGEFVLEAVVATTNGEDQVRAALETVPDILRAELRLLHEDELAPGPQRIASSEPVPVAASRPNFPAAGNGSAPARKPSQSVRIDVERLDGLMNLVGELVIDRTRLQQIKDVLATVLKDANLNELTQNLEETTAHLARVTDELQEEIMRSRMLPIRSVLTRLPRLVRDVANRSGKRVELITVGEETELDRSVIEELSDPLVHILRNAVDHGIESPEERRAAGKPETGTVTVTAWNQETYIYVSIRDDGKGLDLRKLRDKVIEHGLAPREVVEAASDEAVMQYIFLPGLSTASLVSDVSGRGVGMDIVRTNIERLNGHVTVRSTPGVGSEFTIQLPLTLATTKALMVAANETIYAMPLVSVTEALAEEDADIHLVGGQRTLRLRGQLLPVRDLAESLGDRRTHSYDGPRYVVAARHGDSQVAFVVDRLLGEQDVVVKSLGDLMGNRRGLSGATILGDGTLGLIIDTPSLVGQQSIFRTVA